jgi:hypothetical protein
MLWAEMIGFRFSAGAHFTRRHRPDRLWGPPSLLANSYRGSLSPGAKRLRREHPTLTST